MTSTRSQRILVTGGAGFIGSHVCQKLLEQGHTVVCFDNLDDFYDPAEKRRNLEEIGSGQNFLFVKNDICDTSSVSKAINKHRPEIIVHLAARAGVRPSILHPQHYQDVNVQGTLVLLEAARMNNIRNFVFASSSSVYGDQTDLPFRETARTDSPLSPYGATKKACEVLCYTYYHLYGLSISCLRLFTVYGKRQRPDLAIRRFTELILQGREITIYGDGSTSRDYTHVSDIVRGILGAMNWGNDVRPKYGVFNLGSSSPISLSELVAKIEGAVGKTAIIKRLSVQPGEVQHTYSDSAVAERELGFRRTVNFDDGLKEFVEWMRQR